ncbi:phosphotransferase [Nocardioides houyundeii]|uniref:phosphotransferase n=1 Tax=Nocardioides houyundeii TaxID=2045452 RepID=UPI000DF23226|nr:phosphotransferase [Nocardioides houyundeii]
MTTYPVPGGASAIRLDWPFLPPRLRTFIERKCGSAVVASHSRDAGFTPGFASVLVCEDGTQHFVKAASAVAQRMSASSYRTEGRTLAALPHSVPAPRLQWMLDDDWVALGIQYAEGPAPRRPWSPVDLSATLDALQTVAEDLSSAPAGLQLGSFADDFAGDHWASLRATRPRLAHADEASALAAEALEVVRGTAVVHTDVRDDNLLVTDAGVLVCDWGSAVLGAPWLDSLIALIGPRGDGLDVQDALRRPMLRDVPAEDVDRVLALLAGYFLAQGALPVPAASPYLRAHQAWQGEACWQWLCERREWSPTVAVRGAAT